MKSKGPNLYNPIVKRIQLLEAIAENEGELSPELAAQLEVNDANISERSEFLLETRNEALLRIADADAQIARLQAFKVQSQRGIDAIDGQLKAAVLRLGSINAGTYKLSLRKSTAVVVKDDAEVPREYSTFKEPAEGFWAPDRAKLKKALEAGTTIPGVILETRENLQIK